MHSFSFIIRSVLIPAFLVSVILPPSLQAETFYESLPNPRVTENSWILDQAGILGEYKQQMDSLISQYESHTGTEIAVVILPTIGERVPKEAATEIFNLWGVGKKGKDNGVLVLHVLDQRRIEIEVGYGLEGVLTDVKSVRILDNITVPFFKESLFGPGHLSTIQGIIGVIENPDLPMDDIPTLATLTPEEALEQGIQPSPEPAIPELDESLYDDTPVRPSQIGGLATLGGGFLLWILWQFIYIIYRITRRPDPYSHYKFYSGVGGWFQYPAFLTFFSGPVVWEVLQYETFFSAIPGLAAAIAIPAWFRHRKLKHLRSLPRKCSECGKEIPVKLSESADDEFLDAGQRTEEKIKSVDYDVWKCSCGNHMIEEYEGDVFAYDCPSCKYKTYQIIKSVTIRPATTSSSGLAKDYYKCRHCNHEEVKERVIPQKSSSSGSRSGGGGGGGSFGGGSSGGGGGGSSY